MQAIKGSEQAIERPIANDVCPEDEAGGKRKNHSITQSPSCSGRDLRHQLQQERKAVALSDKCCDVLFIRLINLTIRDTLEALILAAVEPTSRDYAIGSSGGLRGCLRSSQLRNKEHGPGHEDEQRIRGGDLGYHV